MLRPYSLSDAKELQRLIGDREVSDTLQLVPYPYLDGMAEEWINQQTNEHLDVKNTHYRKDIHFAITSRECGFLMGTFSIMNISKVTDKAEIGYWLGKPYWGKGYCTEAAKTGVKFCFEELGLNRISATHMTRNPRSGRVMEKIGMKYEGHMRQYGKKWDKYEDGEMRAILRSDCNNQSV
ncbi:MAG TPA: GNAT family N-acetyltransferase [Dehalococcoidales bacterium]|nr:GNAT family N-acetyltransferase [Dehalococcoidales bacterium]